MRASSSQGVFPEKSVQSLAVYEHIFHEPFDEAFEYILVVRDYLRGRLLGVVQYLLDVFEHIATGGKRVVLEDDEALVPHYLPEAVLHDHLLGDTGCLYEVVGSADGLGVPADDFVLGDHAAHYDAYLLFKVALGIGRPYGLVHRYERRVVLVVVHAYEGRGLVEVVLHQDDMSGLVYGDATLLGIRK